MPGRILSGLCAVTGIIIIALPVSLINSNFSLVFHVHQKKEALVRKVKERRALTIEKLLNEFNK